MTKAKYYYDYKTLSYKQIKLSLKQKIFRIGFFIGTSFLLGFLMLTLFLNFVDSPKEKQLKRELENMIIQYSLLNERMNQVASVLEEIQDRDDDIYRVIFEAEPISSNIREAGFGGVNRYKDLEGFNDSELIIKTAEMVDKISKQLYIQSISFDEVIKLAKNKADMLESIPAIQPVSNTDLKRVASGYGYRIHPIYKTRKMHAGMDFSAPIGTPIYSTGKGKVVKVVSKTRGYGKYVVIDHGYGYETLYAHMNDFNVHQGKNVKRGDVIGWVGNSGTSTSPHLHYEVLKNGSKINPINFFYNDLSPEEYERMIEISSQYNQTFD